MNTELKNVLVILAILAVCGVLVFLVRPKGQVGPIDTTALVREGSPMTGTMGAKVTVVEFGDYECPACASYHPLVKQLIVEYGSNPDFNFVFRNFPLPMHKHAEIASEAAEAARAQGKFWEMQDLLYTKQSEWSKKPDPVEDFLGYAAALNLDTARFKSDLDNRTYRALVQSDVTDGNALNVQATPSFFVNGVLQRNIGSYTQLKQVVDAALN